MALVLSFINRCIGELPGPKRYRRCVDDNGNGDSVFDQPDCNAAGWGINDRLG